MAKYPILKAVEFDKTSAKFRKQYGSVQALVGSGVPHEFCGEGMLDRIVEIECLGVTEDGKLREPRYRGVRHDKVDTDG